MAGRERAGTNIETKPSSAAPVQQRHHPATTNALQSERGRPRPPRSKQKPQPLTHERSSVGARPSSAAPVQQNHPCNPEFVTLMPRLMEKEIERIAQQRRSECQRDGLLDGGGRGRPRSDRRAFVVQGWGLLLDGGPRTAALRQKSVRGAG